MTSDDLAKKVLFLHLASVFYTYHAHHGPFTSYSSLDDGENVSTTAASEAPAVVEPPAPAPRTTNNRGRAAQPSAQSRSGRYYKRGGAPVAVESTDADALASPNSNVPRARFDRTEARRAFFLFHAFLEGVLLMVIFLLL